MTGNARQRAYFIKLRLHQQTHIHKTRYKNHLKIYATKNTSTKQSYPNTFGIKKRKSRIFDQMGHRQAHGKRNCTLCLEEKLMIKKDRSKNILNRRFEMLSKCRFVIYHHYFTSYLWLCVLIHLIPKWRPINYSFVCMLMSPVRLVNMYQKTKQFSNENEAKRAN